MRLIQHVTVLTSVGLTITYVVNIININSQHFDMQNISKIAAPIRGYCEPGWDYAPDGTCTLAVDEKQTWQSAQKVCEQSGGHLVVIRTAPMNFFVFKTIFFGPIDGHIFIGKVSRIFSSISLNLCAIPYILLGNFSQK